MNDKRLMQAAFEVAWKARHNGNHPFGALLTDADGNILLVAENTVVTDHDCTCHAETNLMRKASRKYEPDFLKTCSLYTSTEPCAMCASAIFWGNVRRVVYGLSEEGLYSLTGDSEEKLLLSCREVFAHGRKEIEVVGPILEDEASVVHEGFWK